MTNGPKVISGSRDWRDGKRLGCAIVVLTLSSCLTATDHSDNDLATGNGLADGPAGNPQSGRQLFVNKGCIICHSVNDVGGRAALPLDAPPEGQKVDPLVFAAAMWQGASAMLSLQLNTIGYQIGVTGDELRDLAAFASDLEAQAEFSLDDVPADIRPWIIDAPHWLKEEWPEPFKSQPDGIGPLFEDL